MTVYIDIIAHAKKVYKSTGADNNTVATAMFWTIMESGLALTGACLPTLYGLVKDAVRKPRNSSGAYLHAGSGSDGRSMPRRFGGSKGGHASNGSIHDSIPMVSSFGPEVEARAETASLEGEGRVPADGIVVQKSFGRVEEDAGGIYR